MNEVSDCSKVPDYEVISVSRNYLTRWSVSDRCYNDPDLNVTPKSTINNIKLLFEEFRKAHVDIQNVGATHECLGKLRDRITSATKTMIHNYISVINHTLKHSSDASHLISQLNDFLSSL